MSRYSIDGQILTDIADSIRSKGNLYEPIGEPQIACTPGADPDNGMWYNGEEGWSQVEHIFVFRIPGASKYRFDLRTRYFNNNAFYYAPGEWDTKPADAIQVRMQSAVFDYEWEVVGDVVTLFYKDYLMTDANGGYGFYLTVYGFSNTIIPEEMAIRIGAMPTLDASLLNMSGSMSYKFYQGAWDGFINSYGDKIVTDSINNLNCAFQSSKIEKIPFVINCKSSTNTTLKNMCYGCSNLKEPPIIKNVKPQDVDSIFSDCKNLREFPEGYGEDWDWSYHTSATGSYDGAKSEMFDGCYSLRKLPMGLLKYGNVGNLSASSSQTRGFYRLYALDEIIGFPVPHNTVATSTGYSGIFYNFGSYCYRLKNMTFADDIGPKSWSNQTLDFTTYCGWASSVQDLISYNSGITLDKRVEDDASYQALKDDPDWFTGDAAYSRYNHDSAVATINSLPDCSAYQTTNNKVANIIKFKGVAGSATDGGAINTLTDEEIAVAAAKGWTVSIV